MHKSKRKLQTKLKKYCLLQTKLDVSSERIPDTLSTLKGLAAYRVLGYNIYALDRCSSPGSAISVRSSTSDTSTSASSACESSPDGTLFDLTKPGDGIFSPRRATITYEL